MPSPRLATTLEELCRAYPHWIIRRSGAGRFWAQRFLTVAEYDAGCKGLLDDDSLQGLAALLYAEQILIESLAPVALPAPLPFEKRGGLLP
ncbi:hypothetical protein AB0K21_21730 [Streptosporangium sp. NPDC049248]|uniref:hypothetical protein n=1 Tax=Streptosporangium sp. NPDC049248 TaxID=3155651 RepID=UPI00342444FA